MRAKSGLVERSQTGWETNASHKSKAGEVTPAAIRFFSILISLDVGDVATTHFRTTFRA